MQQMIAAMQLEKQYRGDVEAIRQQGETQRKLMDVTSRAYNTDTINEAKVNQTNMKAVTEQNKAELDAMTKVILAGVSPQMLQAEIERRNQEQLQMASFAAAEVNQTQNPFIAAGQALSQQNIEQSLTQLPRQ